MRSQEVPTYTCHRLQRHLLRRCPWTKHRLPRLNRGPAQVLRNPMNRRLHLLLFQWHRRNPTEWIRRLLLQPRKGVKTRCQKRGELQALVEGGKGSRVTRQVRGVPQPVLVILLSHRLILTLSISSRRFCANLNMIRLTEKGSSA